MSLGADVAAVLPELRMAAESRMRETCRVRIAPADSVWDDDTNSYTDAEPAYSYQGPCRVKFGATQPRESDAVGRPFVEQQIEVHFPIGTSTDIDVGQDIEILTAANDSDLVGVHFRVTGRFHQTDATARRLPVEEVS